MAEVVLNDNNNSRGFELTVTGSGFNNDTTATAYVLNRAPTTGEWWNELNCAEMNMVAGSSDTEGNGYCRMYAALTDAEKAIVGMADTTKGKASVGVCRAVVTHGTAVGTANVGKDDTAAVPVTVSVPAFKPGRVNHICLRDGEGHIAGGDVEIFELEDSIRVVPTTVNAGDTVTVFAQDFEGTPSFTKLLLGGQQVNPGLPGKTSVSVGGQTGITTDGSATVTFDMPGSIDGNSVQGHYCG